MPGGQEIVSSIYGAWRILRLDPHALDHFNLSVEGFWHSFFAVLLVAPGIVLLVLIGYDSLPVEKTAETSRAYAVVAHLTGFLLARAAFPVAMIWVSRLLKLEQRYTTYIIIWNWSMIIAMAIMLPLAILLSLGVLSPGLVGGIMIFAFGYVLFFAYLVARIGLACGAGTAVAIVVFDEALEHLVDLGVSTLLQAPAL